MPRDDVTSKNRTSTVTIGGWAMDKKKFHKYKPAIIKYLCENGYETQLPDPGAKGSERERSQISAEVIGCAGVGLPTGRDLA